MRSSHISKDQFCKMYLKSMTEMYRMKTVERVMLTNEEFQQEQSLLSSNFI